MRGTIGALGYARRFRARSNLMLNSQAQSPLADALASIQRAQVRATSDALAASVRGWSMWTQMLKARPAMDEQPMARSFGSTLWSMSWPMIRPLPGLLE